MKIKDGSNLPLERQREIDNFIVEDMSNWEDGDYGKDPQYRQRIPFEESKQLQRAIQGPDGLKAISIKMPPVLLNELRSLAAEDNIGYQTYIKQILSRYVRDEKRKRKPA